MESLSTEKGKGMFQYIKIVNVLEQKMVREYLSTEKGKGMFQY